MDLAGEFAPATDTGPAAAPAGRLFHFTSLDAWESIQHEGVLRAVGTAASGWADPGRLVVWLTDLTDPRTSGRNDDFAQVRLTVPAHPDVRYWPALAPTTHLAETLNATPGSVSKSWYCCLGNIPLDNVVAHTVRTDGTWPDPDPGAVDATDAFGPAPDLADLAAWRERCEAALLRITPGVVNDVLVAALANFHALPALLDDLLAGDPDGMRLRIAWRSAHDVARDLGAGT